MGFQSTGLRAAAERPPGRRGRRAPLTANAQRDLVAERRPRLTGHADPRRNARWSICTFQGNSATTSGPRQSDPAETTSMPFGPFWVLEAPKNRRDRPPNRLSLGPMLHRGQPQELSAITLKKFLVARTTLCFTCKCRPRSGQGATLAQASGVTGALVG